MICSPFKIDGIDSRFHNVLNFPPLQSTLHCQRVYKYDKQALTNNIQIKHVGFYAEGNIEVSTLAILL